MSDVNLTVGKLKEILNDLPDDMEVIVPTYPDAKNPNVIDSFRYLRSAGWLTMMSRMRSTLFSIHCIEMTKRNVLCSLSQFRVETLNR